MQDVQTEQQWQGHQFRIQFSPTSARYSIRVLGVAHVVKKKKHGFGSPADSVATSGWPQKTQHCCTVQYTVAYQASPQIILNTFTLAMEITTCILSSGLPACLAPVGGHVITQSFSCI